MENNPLAPALNLFLNNRTVSNAYSDGYIYLNVTGLRRLESYRRYWIRITHTEYGEPYDLSSPNSYYYSDEKGEQTVIRGYSVHEITENNNRLVGVYYKGWTPAFPKTTFAKEEAA